MGRLVTPRRAGGGFLASAEETTPDGGLARIAKYVPAEILSFYALWIQGVAFFSPDWEAVAILVGTVVGVIATIIYFARAFPNALPQVRRSHMIVSPLAFIVYAYNLSASVVPQYFHPGVAVFGTALIILISWLMQPTVSPQTTG